MEEEGDSYSTSTAKTSPELNQGQSPSPDPSTTNLISRDPKTPICANCGTTGKQVAKKKGKGRESLPNYDNENARRGSDKGQSIERDCGGLSPYPPPSQGSEEIDWQANGQRRGSCGSNQSGGSSQSNRYPQQSSFQYHQLPKPLLFEDQYRQYHPYACSRPHTSPRSSTPLIRPKFRAHSFDSLPTLPQVPFYPLLPSPPIRSYRPHIPFLPPVPDYKVNPLPFSRFSRQNQRLPSPTLYNDRQGLRDPSLYSPVVPSRDPISPNHASTPNSTQPPPSSRSEFPPAAHNFTEFRFNSIRRSSSLERASSIVIGMQPPSDVTLAPIQFRRRSNSPTSSSTTHYVVQEQRQTNRHVQETENLREKDDEVERIERGWSAREEREGEDGSDIDLHLTRRTSDTSDVRLTL